MFAVLDPNVLISSLLSASGSPARLMEAWLGGAFELIVSPKLLEELGRALSYPQLRRRLDADEAAEFVELLGREGMLVEDPNDPPTVRSSDPGDDYLLALAESRGAAVISGDRHLLDLRDAAPVMTPADFLTMLEG